MAEKYDRIILDTSALQEVSDALFIAKHADSTVFVVDAKDTTARIAKTTIERLDQIGVRIDGVIINNSKIVN